MLSRLNLPVTVATLLVALVCGTAVSHAGQAGGELCNTAPPVLRAGQTVGDRQADLVFTPPVVDGVPGKVNIPPGYGDFRYSLCEGRVLAADEVSRRCTRQNVRKTNQSPNLGCIVRGGTQASYVFAVPPGQKLPEGVSIDGFGILHVHEEARLARTDIRVCVRQLNAVFDSCQNIGLNQPPALTLALTQKVNAAAPPPAEGVGSPDAGGGNVIVPLAVAGGAGVGTWMILDQSGLLDNLGGGGGGSCTSTRNCVVNSFSGGCSCSGTTNGPCDFSGTPGGVGASCGSGSVCRSGLQCTNGRCETPPGRC